MEATETATTETMLEEAPAAPPPPPPVTRESLAAAAPRRERLWAALFYAVCAMSLGFPALAGKFLAGQYSDQFIAGYAFREFGARVLEATGGFAQWNPYIFGGMPYIAAMHGDIFYPTFLMRMVMPTDAAMTWSFIIHLFLAGFFTFRFLRISGFGFFASLAGGAGYMLSGQLASLVSPGHDGKLTVSALFPLALWMLTLGLRDGKRWSWGLLSLTVGLAVLSPHPQLLQYMLLASAAFAIYLAISSIRRRTVNVRVMLGRMALSLVAVAIGLAIGAIQYLPVREYVAWSPRAGGLADYATATSYGWPLRELFDAYLPQFTGMIEAYWGVNAIHLHSDYVGAVVLLLAGAAFGGLGTDKRKGFIVFWAITLVIALLWALGGDTPFYQIPYAIVPGTKYFRAPATVFFVGTLGLSVLVAAGTERFLTRELSLWYLVGWLVFGGAIAGLAMAGVLNDFAQALAPDEMVDTVIANAGEVTFGAWRSFAFVLAMALLMIAHRKGRVPVRIAGLAVAVLIAVDDWTIMRKYWIFSEPASVAYRTDDTIERIKADSLHSRVLTLELEPNPRRDTNLQGDGLMIHRVGNVLGYHGNQLARYNVLLQKDEGFQQVFNPRIWEMLNVRYLLTNSADVGTFFQGAQWVIGPVENAAGTNVYLYRLPGENPYAWVTPSFVKADDDAIIATIFNPGFDVRSLALFSTDAEVEESDSLAALGPPAVQENAARVTNFQPGQVSLELAAPAGAGSALIVSENYYPGWAATVDGKAAPIGRVDYTLIGVQLPEGGRKIELSFRSATYEKGKAITLAAVVLTLILITAGTIMERRAVA